VAVAVVFGLMATGCGGSGSDEQSSTTSTTLPSGITTQNLEGDADATPVEGGRLIFGLEAETDGWNTTQNRWALSGHMVGSSIFDPLATIDASGETVPYLAESLTANDDFTEWTITVKPGVTFHDGKPLTSADVKATFDGHLASLITSYAVLAIDTVEVVDDRTVTLTMNEPWVSFPYTLTTQIGYVMQADQVANPEAATTPIGTGPFMFDEWTPNEELKVTKYDSYWQPGKPYLGSIDWRPIPDAQERADALLAGEVDAINTLSPLDIVDFRGEEVKMVEYAAGEEAFVTLNTQQPPFDRREARLALAYATDIDRYIEETGKSAVVVAAKGPFAEGDVGYRTDNGYAAYDLEKAKQYVADYTAATGQPLSFEYKGSANLNELQGQQTLQAMWEEAGIDVIPKSVPQESQILDAALGNYQAIEFRNFGALDPDGEVVWWHSRSVGEPGAISLNFPRFGNDTVDQALIDARGSTDPAVRDEAYALVARTLNEESPYVWLERVNWAIVANMDVYGIGAAQNGSLSTLASKTWLTDLWIG